MRVEGYTWGGVGVCGCEREKEDIGSRGSIVFSILLLFINIYCSIGRMVWL